MIGELLAAPALVLAASLPLGLALVRLAWRGAPPAHATVLAAPAGYSLLVLVLEGARVTIGGTRGWIVPLVAVGGIALAVASRATLPRAELAWLLGTVLALYAVLTAPEWLQAGHTAILGYQRNNDPVFLTVLSQLIAEGKEAIPPPSVTDAYLSYPAGSLDVIAGLTSTLGRTAFDVTQPAHAITVALVAPCVAGMLQRLGASRFAVPLAALGVLTALPVIWYVEGATPSMMMLVPLLATLLFTWDAAREARPLVGALAGLCAGAAVTMYGLSTLGWIASFAALVVAATVSERGTASLRPLALAGAAAVAAGILAFPGAVRAWRFNVESHDAVTGGLVLGNLGGALDPLLAVGVDRTLLPVLTLPAFAVAGALVLVGVGRGLARPASLATTLLFACAFTTIYATLAGPYYVAKALTVANVVLVALAICGAQELWTGFGARRPALAALGAAGALYAAGSVYTAVYYLRTSAKTPAYLTRLDGVRRTVAARGPALIVSPAGQTWTAWALRSPGLRVSRLEGVGPHPGPGVVNRYATIIVEPGGSAPGAPFRLWRRVGDLAVYER